MSAPAASMIAFHPSGKLFASVMPAVDRHRLKLWDAQANALKGEFSNEKITRFSCIAWGAMTAAGKQVILVLSSHAQKKSLPELDVVAIGTDDGSIFVYSVNHGEVIKTLAGGHMKRVNDVVFSANGTTAYSCSDDGLIIEWNLATGVKMAYALAAFADF